jgi:hypothetical protein
MEPDKDHSRCVALLPKTATGLADPEDVATELGIELSEVTELVLRVSHMIQPTRVGTPRRAVSRRSAGNHPSDSVH